MPAQLFLLFALLVPCWVIAYHGLGDLPMYYAVAGYVSSGALERVYASNAGVGHFFYAPLSLPLFSWMPFFSYGMVKFLWVVINTVSYVLFWWGLLKLYPFLRERKAIPFFIFVWIVSIKSIHASFQTHNVQLVIGALLVLAEYLSHSQKQKKQVWAGVIPSFLGSIKVFPFFFSLFYFLRGPLILRVSVVLGALIALSFPLLWFGPDVGLRLYQDFYRNIFSFHNYAPLTQDAVTLSMASLFASWFSPSLGMPTSLLLSNIVSLFLVVVYFVGLKDRKGTDYWALGIALMALVNSSTRPDYFIFFVPAFASASRFVFEKRFKVWHLSFFLLAFSFLCLISEWTLGSRDLGHKLELLRLPVVGMILLCVALYFLLRSQKQLSDA